MCNNTDTYKQTPVGLIPSDWEVKRLGDIVDEKRPTTRKTRVMAKHHHLVRVDYEVKKYVSAAIEQQIFQYPASSPNFIAGKRFNDCSY